MVWPVVWPGRLFVFAGSGRLVRPGWRWVAWSCSVCVAGCVPADPRGCVSENEAAATEAGNRSAGRRESGECGSEGRRTLSWLIVLAVLRRSVLCVVWEPSGSWGLRDCAVVFVAICLLPAVVGRCGVSWPECVVAVLCGLVGACAGACGVRFGSALARGGAALACRDCSFLVGVGVRWGLGIVLVPPPCLLLKVLAALVLDCAGEVEGSGRGLSCVIRWTCSSLILPRTQDCA